MPESTVWNVHHYHFEELMIANTYNQFHSHWMIIDEMGSREYKKLHHVMRETRPKPGFCEICGR